MFFVIDIPIFFNAMKNVASSHIAQAVCITRKESLFKNVV